MSHFGEILRQKCNV